MLTILKRIFEIFSLLVSGKGEMADEAILSGAVDYSGQGRDIFGK